MGQNKRLTVTIQFDGGSARKRKSLLWTAVIWAKRLFSLATIIAALAKFASG